MNAHFSNIDRIKEKIRSIYDVNDLEQKYKLTIEQAYNISQTDSALSDALYYEANLLKQQIDKIKASYTYNFAAV